LPITKLNQFYHFFIVNLYDLSSYSYLHFITLSLIFFLSILKFSFFIWLWLWGTWKLWKNYLQVLPTEMDYLQSPFNLLPCVN